MPFLIKSDFIKHLFFYFCFFYRSLQLLFKPNQTQKKKKKFQIPENKLPEIYFAVDPCPPFSATNHKKIHTYKYSCWRLWFLRVQYVLVMGSPISRAPVRRLRSTLREIAPSRDRDPFARSRRRDRDHWWFFSGFVACVFLDLCFSGFFILYLFNFKFKFEQTQKFELIVESKSVKLD